MMNSSLITVPLRLGLATVRVGLLATARVLEVTSEVAEALIRNRLAAERRASAEPAPATEPKPKPKPAKPKPAKPKAAKPKPPPRRKPAPPAAASEPPPPPPAAESEPPPPAPASEPPPPPAAAPSEPPPPPSPAHVSSEPTMVEEVSEPGAEDGAGAEVHVDEPWDGYDRLQAQEIIDRLSGASTAELGAVELYELSGRQRKSVLEAVQRELRRPQATS